MEGKYFQIHDLEAYMKIDIIILYFKNCYTILL
jgi:hypothetical protein